MKERKLLAIIPAYNEGQNISDLIAGIKLYCTDLDILVIDDGSHDDTYEKAKTAGANVAKLPFNLGIGGAVQTGLLYARNNSYESAVQVDGDGQHKPEEIKKILYPVLNGEADVAIGSRFLQNGGFKSSFCRRLGILVFRTTILLLTGQTITDSTSGFRAFSKRAILFLADHYPCDYPEAEVVVILSRNNFKIREYPVEMSKRQGGKSSITPVKSAYYMVKVLLSILVSCLRAPDIKNSKP
jgi:glycosyltransferase involved in cell wall biosynthesis